MYKEHPNSISLDCYRSSGRTYNYIKHEKRKEFPKYYFSLPIPEQFVRILGKTLDSPKILDLGSGSGSESNQLVKLFPNGQIISVDISTEGSRIGKNRFDLNQIQADVSYPPFAQEQFNGIHCKDVLVHIPNKDNFLQQVSRLLAPSGIFLLMSSEKIDKNLDQFEWSLNEIITLAKRYGLDLIAKDRRKLKFEDWYRMRAESIEEVVFSIIFFPFFLKYFNNKRLFMLFQEI